MAANYPTALRILSLLILSTSTYTLAGAQTVPQINDKPNPKPWLNTETKIELSLVAASFAADGYTTRNLCAGIQCQESNPVARPFTSSNSGTATYFGLAMAGTVGGNWALRHHPWMRRTLNAAIVVGEISSIVHNSRQHPPVIIPGPPVRCPNGFCGLH